MAELEYLDQVDKNGKVIGCRPRSEFHNNPRIIHPVVHCWLFNSKGQILLQKRASTKQTYPGHWDISAAGHISSGENHETTLLRECGEELGVVPQKYLLCDKYVFRQEQQTELIYLFAGLVNIPRGKFKLQTEEVEEIEWVDIDRAISESAFGKRKSTPWVCNQLPKILQLFVKERFAEYQT